MAGLKKLPIGIENFEEMRREDFYYVDKSHVIEQLLTQWGKVNLFTRPRRFGKSLNMSMLKSFFEIERILHYLLVCIFLKILSFVKNIWGNILSSQSV